MALASGCLITDVPENEEPVRTRPQLLNPDPHPTEFLRVIAQNNSSTIIPFSAEVLSEDLPNENIEVVLIVDYGVEDAQGNPWLRAYDAPVLKPGTLAEGPRPFTVNWQVEPAIIDTTEDPNSAGCHSITLLVTHQFRETPIGQYCPAVEDDYATITWFASVCSEDQYCTFENCPTAGTQVFTYCDTPEVMQ